MLDLVSKLLLGVIPALFVASLTVDDIEKKRLLKTLTGIFLALLFVLCFISG